jgi:3-oxoacyl-[acyl-carrier-protein] synthase-3
MPTRQDSCAVPTVSTIGTHLPPTRISNLSDPATPGTNDDFIANKIGVVNRAVKAPKQSTSDLCVHAYEDLTEQIPVDTSTIDLLCVVTQNPDMRIPHTSALLHEKLGLSDRCMTFDLSQGCAGYTHGLAVVTALLQQFGLAHALLVTCDPYSMIVDPRDRATAPIFGDAATVTYLSTERPGYQVLDADFGTAPGTTSVLRCDTGTLRMDGRAVFLNAAREPPKSIARILERNDLGILDVDLFLLHPGSKRIIDVIRKELGVDETRLPFEIADYGNTVSSSIPLMLQSRLTGYQPKTVLLCGFGVGFTWGTCLISYTHQQDTE